MGNNHGRQREGGLWESGTGGLLSNRFQIGPVIGCPFFQSLIHLYLWTSYRQDKFWDESFVGGMVSLFLH